MQLTINKTTKMITITGTNIKLSNKIKSKLFRLENQGYSIRIIVG